MTKKVKDIIQNSTKKELCYIVSKLVDFYYEHNGCKIFNFCFELNNKYEFYWGYGYTFDINGIYTNYGKTQITGHYICAEDIEQYLTDDEIYKILNAEEHQGALYTMKKFNMI